MSVTQAQTKIVFPQLLAFTEMFFSDADLVEKCQIDLIANANSQDTEPDSDDEMTQLQSEAEPIR